IISCLIYWNELPKSVKTDLEDSIESIKLIEETEFLEPLTPTEIMLKSMRIPSLRSLILSQQIKEDPGLSSKLLPSLLANIRFLDLDDKLVSRLKKSGFTTIADLLLNTSKTISVKSKLSKNAIDEIVENLKIDIITSKIKSMEKEHLHDAFYLNATDKIFLKSIGVYSLADLNENTIFEWFVSKPKIQKIKSKINALLDTNILFYPGITTRVYSTIVEQYFMKNIFTVKDLMILTHIEKMDELVEFLTFYSTNKPKIQAGYITTLSFLKEIEFKDLYKSSVIFEKSSTINDLIVTLYQNYENLSMKGYEILQLINYPLSISLKLNHDEIKDLQRSNIFSIGDLITKPAGYWATFTPVKLKKKILEILSTINAKTIENDCKKRVQIKNMKIFDANLKLQLTTNFTTIDEVILAIKSEDSRILKPIERKVEKILKTPISLLKPSKITLKGWKRLLSSISTLEEFFILSDNELAKILSSSKEEAVKLQNNLGPTDIIFPPRIKENKIFTSTDVAELSANGISNYTQLFDYDTKITKLSVSVQDKIEFYSQFDVKQLDDGLDETILLKDFVILGSYFDTLSLSKNQKDSIQNISSALLSRGTCLSKILEIDTGKETSNLLQTPIEYLLLIEKYQPKVFTKIVESFPEKLSHSFNNLVQYLNRSPILLAGPNLDNVSNVAKLPYNDIKDLLMLSKEKLNQDIENNSVQRHVRSLTLSLLKDLDSKLTSIPKEFLTAYEINQLKKEAIYSFEEALVFNRKSTSKKSKAWILSEKVRQISTINTLSLSSYLSSSKIQERLLKLKINNVYELVYYCNNTEKVDDLSLCQSVIKSVTSINIEEIETKERNRFSKFFNESDILAFLRNQNIRTFGPLINFFESLKEEEHTIEIEKILSVMRVPVTMLSPNTNLVVKLENEGFIQVIDLLIPANIFDRFKGKLTEAQQKALRAIISKASYQDLQLTISKEYYPIAKLSLIDDNLRNDLIKAGYSTVAHLKTPEEIIANTSKLNLQHTSRIRRLLETPAYFMTEMIKDFPQGSFSLHSQGINTLWDVFLTTSKELSQITGIS
ncbi:MAG: hypothetical protein KGD64_14300, partial [Candidatus Heimdallarchaeota archaeon]|nr:hypothetical protein [Candidatus Heimdallarchaeota archaeon]